MEDRNNACKKCGDHMEKLINCWKNVQAKCTYDTMGQPVQCIMLYC